MSKEKSIWSKIWDLIMELLSSSTRTQNSTDPQPTLSETSSAAKTIKDFVKEEARVILEEKAADLAVSFGAMLENLSPKQKEYVKKIAILKAAETSELTFEEVLALGDVLNEAQKLQIEITEELGTFWNKVGAIAKEVAVKTGQVGFKLAARTLVGYLPI